MPQEIGRKGKRAGLLESQGRAADRSVADPEPGGPEPLVPAAGHAWAAAGRRAGPREGRMGPSPRGPVPAARAAPARRQPLLRVRRGLGLRPALAQHALGVREQLVVDIRRLGRTDIAEAAWPASTDSCRSSRPLLVPGRETRRRRSRVSCGVPCGGGTTIALIGPSVRARCARYGTRCAGRAQGSDRGGSRTRTEASRASPRRCSRTGT